jgi:hypothetical protein
MLVVSAVRSGLFGAHHDLNGWLLHGKGCRINLRNVFCTNFVLKTICQQGRKCSSIVMHLYNTKVRRRDF